MVLVVDDDPSTRFVLRMILETAGHVVTEAEHGAAALARFSPDPPDIVTTDLMMPVLGGKELIERLRSQPTTASIPIVVVSGSPDPPDIVTTDLMMPVLGGKELIERLRSQPTTASIPIVVVSGSPADARALHAAGLVEAFIIKPFDARDLLKCIGNLAGKLNSAGAEALAS